MKVSIVQCNSYEPKLLEEKLEEVLYPLGGLKRYIQPGARVLVKPNLLLAQVPEKAVTTHPEFVKAVVQRVKNAGAIPLIGDSPGAVLRGVKRVWERTGMLKVAEELGVELVNFESCGSEKVKIDHPYISNVYISKAIFQADRIISLPKFKTHGLSLITGAVKNSYGFVPGVQKANLHKALPNPDDFSQLLVHIFKVREPDLILMDGILAMEGRGPSNGDPRWVGFILASDNAFALDMIVAYLMGYNPKKVETIRYAIEKGFIPGDIKKIDYFGPSLEALKIKDFKRQSNRVMRLFPPSAARFIARFVWMRPEIDLSRCTRCGACNKTCPTESVKKVGEDFVIFDETCINCLCCQEICEYQAVEVKRSLLAKIIDRQ